MTQGPIENPVINSPFVEPVQHFVTTADGTVTGEIEPRRRPSEFFVPVARPKKLSSTPTSYRTSLYGCVASPGQTPRRTTYSLPECEASLRTPNGRQCPQTSRRPWGASRCGRQGAPSTARRRGVTTDVGCPDITYLIGSMWLEVETTRPHLQGGFGMVDPGRHAKHGNGARRT